MVTDRARIKQVILTAVDEGYQSLKRDGYQKKKTFSPSGLGYQGVCFARETEFVTDEGIKTMGDMVGKEVVVWTGGSVAGNRRKKPEFNLGHGWKKATVKSFGIHKLMKVTLQRNGVKKEIFSTPEHRWIVLTSKFSVSDNRGRAQKVVTQDLEPGMRMWSDGKSPALKNLKCISKDGIRAGLVYGDGTVDRHTFSTRKSSAYIDLHGEKDLQLLYLFNDYQIGPKHKRAISEKSLMNSNQVDIVRVRGLPRTYKDSPSLKESTGYLYGWLAGYFAADGNIHSEGGMSITSHDRDSIYLVRDVCAILGIGYGHISENLVEKLGKIYTEWVITITPRDLTEDFFLLDHHLEYFKILNTSTKKQSPRWTVISVEETSRIEEVYCVVEPVTERFALVDNILTMNCPRYWVLKFRGVESYDHSNTSEQMANMQAGTDRHERLGKILEHSGIMLDVEYELVDEENHVRGFVDGIIEFDNEPVVLEIKTAREEAFIWRKRGKMADANMKQILVYMRLMNIDRGVFLFENNNDKSLYVHPIKMIDEYKEYVDAILAWMKKVYSAYEQGLLPANLHRKNAAICGKCPLKKACFELPREGDIEIEDQPSR